MTNLEIEHAYSATHFVEFLQFHAWSWRYTPYFSSPAFLAQELAAFSGALFQKFGACRVTQSEHHMETLQAVFLFCSISECLVVCSGTSNVDWLSFIFCSFRSSFSLKQSVYSRWHHRITMCWFLLRIFLLSHCLSPLWVWPFTEFPRESKPNDLASC